MSGSYTTTAVRTQIGRCVLGDVSLRELEEWLIPLAWSEDGEAEAVELAWSVELLFMERSSGHRTDEELLTALLPLATIELGEPRTAVLSTSADITSISQDLIQRLPADAPRAAVSAL